MNDTFWEKTLLLSDEQGGEGRELMRTSKLPRGTSWVILEKKSRLTLFLSSFFFSFLFFFSPVQLRLSRPLFYYTKKREYLENKKKKKKERKEKDKEEKEKKKWPTHACLQGGPC